MAPELPWLEAIRAGEMAILPSGVHLRPLDGRGHQLVLGVGYLGSGWMRKGCFELTDICSLLRWIQTLAFLHSPTPPAEPGKGTLEANTSSNVSVVVSLPWAHPHPCSLPPHTTLHRRCLRSASATLTYTRFCRATAPRPIGCCRSCSTW